MHHVLTMTTPPNTPPLLPPRAPLPSVRPSAHRLPTIDEGATPSRSWRWVFAVGCDGRGGDTVPAGAL